MKILTPDNCSYNLNKVPELVDDLQYCVLDTTNPKNIDFFFIPLIFLCIRKNISVNSLMQYFAHLNCGDRLFE